MGDGTKLTVQS